MDDPQTYILPDLGGWGDTFLGQPSLKVACVVPCHGCVVLGFVLRSI